jgi:hypothetical protein
MLKVQLTRCFVHFSLEVYFFKQKLGFQALEVCTNFQITQQLKLESNRFG